MRGRRRVPYSDFHTGYKKNVLAPDELLLAVHLPRRFKSHQQYLRKVGTRRAMAIAKVALAGTALFEGAIVREIRLAAASLAAFPARLYRTEDAICGKLSTQSPLARRVPHCSRRFTRSTTFVPPPNIAAALRQTSWANS